VKLNCELLAKAAGLERLDARLSDLLHRYAEVLAGANQKVNLISRSVDPAIEIEQQIAISLMLMRLAPPGAANWIDIGSGGGFPVIPLACALESIKFTAVEQIAKKAFFVERTAQELGLKNVRVIASSIERVIAADLPTRWDVVSIKAVTDLQQSLEWASELLNHGGLLLTYKPAGGESDRLEIGRKRGFELVNSLDVKELIDTIDVRIVMYKKS